MWRLIYAIPSWILFTLFRTLMILLGWIVVPIAAAFGAYEPWDGHDGVGTPRTHYRFTWGWMFPWDNFEDGIANDTYINFDSMFMKIVYWSCFRNPVNNLRRVPYLSVNIERDKVGYTGSYRAWPNTDPRNYDRDDTTFWYFCWHGFYTNFRWQFKMGDQVKRFWIGWKIYPGDSANGVSGHRKGGAGFANQFKKCWPK